MKDEVTGDYVAGGGHIGLIWVKQYSRDGLVQPINTKKPMAIYSTPDLSLPLT